MKDLKQWRRLIGWLLIGVMAAGLLSACATGGQSATEEAAEEAATTVEIPEVVITKEGDQLSIPSEVPSGPVAFVNNSGASVETVRLNEGVTIEQLQQTLAENEEAALELITLLGSTMVPGTGTVVHDLDPGNYVLAETGDQGSVESVTFFAAGEPSGATAPTADVAVDLVDFAFVMPTELKAGTQTWQITNKGTQWHELAIVKLNEGATIDDVLGAIMAEGEPSGPPPFEMVNGWTPMGPEQTAWVTWDLPAGEYTVLCFLPDLNGDFAPHLTHGMVANVTVTQ